MNRSAVSNGRPVLHIIFTKYLCKFTFLHFISWSIYMFFIKI